MYCQLPTNISFWNPSTFNHTTFAGVNKKRVYAIFSLAVNPLVAFALAHHPALTLGEAPPLRELKTSCQASQKGRFVAE
jgi:hypothetical protein